MTPEAFAQIVNDFLDDAYDHADKLEQCLTALIETPDDERLLEQAHRAAHTIKGSSAMLAIRAPEEGMAERLEAVRFAAAAAEERFEAAQEGAMPLDAGAVGILSALPGMVREMLRLEGEPEGGISGLRQKLEAFAAAVEPKSARNLAEINLDEVDLPEDDSVPPLGRRTDTGRPAPGREFAEVSDDDLLVMFEVAHPAVKDPPSDNEGEDEPGTETSEPVGGDVVSDGDVVMNALSRVFGLEPEPEPSGDESRTDDVEPVVEETDAAAPAEPEPMTEEPEAHAEPAEAEAHEEAPPTEQKPEGRAAPPTKHNRQVLAALLGLKKPVAPAKPPVEEKALVESAAPPPSAEEEPEAVEAPAAEPEPEAVAAEDELGALEDTAAEAEPAPAESVEEAPLEEVAETVSGESDLEVLDGLTAEEEPESAPEALEEPTEPVAEAHDEGKRNALEGLTSWEDSEPAPPAAEKAVTPDETPVSASSDEDDLDTLDGLTAEEEPQPAQPAVEAPVEVAEAAPQPAGTSDEDELDVLAGLSEDEAAEPEAVRPVAEAVPEPEAAPVGEASSDEAELDTLESLFGLEEEQPEEETPAVDEAMEAPEPEAEIEAEEAEGIELEDDPMREVFLMECEEVFGILRTNLDTLRQDAGNEGALRELRRGSHTLKGSAAMLEYEHVREFGLALEELSDALADTGTKPTAEDLALYERGIAWFEEAAEAISKRGKSGRSPEDLREAVEARRAAVGGAHEEEPVGEEASADSERVTPPDEAAPVLELSADDELAMLEDVSAPEPELTTEDDLAALERVETDEPGASADDELSMLEDAEAPAPEEADEEPPESLPDDPMRNIFLEEADHLIDQLNHDLVILEQDPHNRDMVNNILRAAHTLKGSAGTVGFERVQAVSHQMESLLQLIRDEGAIPGAEAVDVLLSSLDYISAATEDIRTYGRERKDESHTIADLAIAQRQLKGEEPPEEQEAGLDTVSGLPAQGGLEADPMREVFVLEATEILETLGRDLVRLEESSGDTDVVNRVLRAAHTLKGSAAMLEFSATRNLAHAMEDSLQAIRDLNISVASSTVDQLLEASDTLARLVDSVAKTGRESGDDVTPQADQLRALAERLRENPAGEADDEHAVVLVEDRSEPEPAPVDESLKETFVEESEQLLTTLVRAVAAIEANGEDMAARQDFLKSIVALSGSAAALRFENIASLSSGMDVVVQAAQDHSLPIEAHVSELLNECMEALTALFATLKKTGADAEPDVTSYVERLNRIAPARRQPAKATQPAAAEQTAEQRRQDDQRSRSRIIEVDLSRLNRLMNLAAELVISRTRLSTELVRLSGIVGELSNQGSALSGMQQRLTGLSPGKMAAGGGGGNGGEGGDEGVLSDFSGAEFDRFSDVDVIARDLRDSSMIVSDLSGDFGALAGNFDQNITRISAIAKELHDEILRVRMVRMERTYTRIPRIVRDAARSERKQVKLVLEGADTEIDKNILEALNTPIMHLLRNMVSHGVESPEERSTRGKPPVGTVTVRAAQEGNQIVLDVSDDGRGIDPSRIRRSAIEKNMLTPQQVNSLSDSEVIDLIFEPGFSSAKEITDISGRGVGLDVVRSVVTRLNGTVNIDTEVGRGTTFRLTLPLTLAIGQALLVQVGERYFAFPLTSVHHIAEIVAEDITYINDQAYIYREDVPVPLVILAEVLGVEQTDAPPTGQARPTVTVREGDRQMALVVDRILGREDIVIKTLGEHLKRVPGISGATILGDGSVVMILHVPYFLSAKTVVARRTATGLPAAAPEPAEKAPTKGARAAKSAKPGASGKGEPSAEPAAEKGAVQERGGRPKGKRRILVVDDSISIRKYVSGVLERNGHSVVTANDGLDAWEKIQSEEFALVISDLEMPRMHGYELIAEIKKFDRTRSIPVVFLTARAGDKHRRMGLELGASAFLNKPFKEPELMEILGTLLEKS